MIFACPSCSASHFKPDADVRSGVEMVCRRCRKPFRVSATGVELVAPASEPAPEAVSEAAPGPALAVAPEVAPEFAPEAAPAVAPEVAPEGVAETAAEVAPDVGFEAAPVGISESQPESPSAEAAPSELFSLELEPPEPEPAGAADADLTEIPEPKPPAPLLAEDTPTGPLPEQLTDAAAAMPDLPAGSSFSFRPTGLMSPPALTELQEESRPDSQTPSGPLVFPTATRDAYGDAGFSSSTIMLQPAEEGATGEPDDEPDRFGSASPDSPPSAPRQAFGARPRFPFQALRAYLGDVAGYVAQLPAARQVAVGAVVVLPVLLIAIWLVHAATAGPPRAWTSSATPLWAGPAVGGGFAQIAHLGRGEQLHVHSSQGDALLVTDVWGRAGYVEARATQNEAFDVTPEEAFAGCRHGPNDSGRDACNQRADDQHRQCVGGCERGDGECIKRCEARFVECLDGCKVLLEVESAVARAASPPAETKVDTQAEAAAPKQEAPREGDSAKEGAAEATKKKAPPPTKKTRPATKKRPR